MRVGLVGVVGAGLIGGSVALRLAALGHEVVVWDPDPATRAAAAQAGLRVGEDAYDAELVVLATPLDALPGAMARAASGPARTVVDVGSVKAGPAAAAATAGLGERYVGLHPMSGTEADGFTHADPGLLVGVSWALVRPRSPEPPAPAAPAVALWLAEVFAATVVVLDAAEHDRAVARISHLPHVLANALLGLVADAGDPVSAWLAAGSFRDGTRVAGRNARRTANMLGDNAAALDATLGELLEVLAGYRGELDDRAALFARLERVVVGAGLLRSPDEPDWRPGGDPVALADVLAGDLPGSEAAVALRATADADAGWEWAPLSSQRRI